MPVLRQLSEQAAARTVAERDAKAIDYVKNFYEIDASDPIYYHLVINAARWEIDAAASLIVNALSLLPPVMSD